MDLLAKVENLQTRVILARYCGSSRAAFMMRSSHPAHTKEAAAAHDAAVAEFARTMLHESSKGVLSSAMLAQAQLPLRLGGVGLTSASGSGEYAYFSAFSDSLRTLLGKDPLSGPISHRESNFVGTFVRTYFGGRPSSHVCFDPFHLSAWLYAAFDSS